MAVLAVLFFAAVPFAMYYNQQYNRFGVIAREQTPVFLTVLSVDADRYVGTFKLTAAEYTSKNSAVKIFVMPLKREFLHAVSYSVAIVCENGILHAFVSNLLQEKETAHAKAYLNHLGEEDGLLLSIKD